MIATRAKLHDGGLAVQTDWNIVFSHLQPRRSARCEDTRNITVRTEALLHSLQIVVWFLKMLIK